MLKVKLRNFPHLTLILIFLMMQSFVGIPVANAGENNGYRGSATVIQPNQDMPTKINTSTVVDWYMFTSSSDAEAVTELALFHEKNVANDLTMSLYDGEPYTEQYLISKTLYSTWDTRTDDLTSKLRPGHKYYLKLQGKGGDSYTLHLSMPPYVDSNAFRGSAKVIQPNQDMPAKINTSTVVDWYMFTSSSDAEAVTELALFHEKNVANDLTMSLYDGEPYSEQYLISKTLYSTWDTRTDDLTAKLRPGHKYYLKLQGKGGDSYTLHLSAPTDSNNSDLAITTTSLVTGTVGALYNVILSASGGTAPYTWNAICLPVGLSINTSTGIISGTPTAAGNSMVTVTVNDSLGRTANVNLSLNVGVGNVGTDVDELNTAIAKATTLIESKSVGTAVGNVSQAAHDAFQAAINVAAITKNNASATQAQVDAAVTDLATATTTFNNAIIINTASNNITGFTVPKQIGNSTINITNHTVSFKMANGTSIKRLKPTITVSAGVTINPKSKAPKDFTKPVIYTVTAQDGTSQNWIVTCVVDPKSSAKDITGFKVPKQVGSSTIDSASHTISFHMANSINVKSLKPTIIVSAEATINPKSKAAKNFVCPVIYTVTAQDGTRQNWTVTCIVDPKS